MSWQSYPGKKKQYLLGKFKTDYDYVSDDTEKILSKIFINYNENVRKPGGFYLPNTNRQQQFNTSSAKAKFNVAIAESLSMKRGDLMMITIRSHDQFNTTIYGLNDRYRSIYNERRINFMNQKDMN